MKPSIARRLSHVEAGLGVGPPKTFNFEEKVERCTAPPQSSTSSAKLNFSQRLLLLTITFLLGCTTPTVDQPLVQVTRAVDEIVVVDIQGGQALAPGTELRILQWEHYVDGYDSWFEQFAREWGARNGIDVVVEFVDITELDARFAQELANGDGSTLIELTNSPSAFIEDLHDLTAINLQAQQLFGVQADTCRDSSYLPTIDSYFAFCFGYVPDPGNYRRDLWTAVGYPEGPKTYDDLLTGGTRLNEQFGNPVGLGLSTDIDSEMMVRAVLWSFGGSVQDENENVVLNSAETIAAVEYIAQLYATALPADTFDWDPASNNNGLMNGDYSYILNSVSAYRAMQRDTPALAEDVAFTSALSGPGGAFASSHTWQIYVIPQYATADETSVAEAFMLHLVANYNQAVFNSELYSFPAFAATVPQLFGDDGWLAQDPFGSTPADKLQVLAGATEWGVHLGYPGVANPAIGQIYNENVITDMVARVVRGEMTAADSVELADLQSRAIFRQWHSKGLVGGDY